MPRCARSLAVVPAVHGGLSRSARRAPTSPGRRTSPRTSRAFFFSPVLFTPCVAQFRPANSTVSVTQFYQRFSESQSRRLTRRRHHLRQDNYPQRYRGYKYIIYVYLTPEHVDKQADTLTHTYPTYDTQLKTAGYLSFFPISCT